MRIPFDVWQAFRVCIHCGAKPFRNRESGNRSILCRDCDLKLNKSRLKSGVSDYFCNVRSLYSWINEPNIQNLIYNLKNSKRIENYFYFAELLVRFDSKTFWSQTQNFMIVPAPAKDENRRDHAFCLAKAISTILSCDFADPFVRTTVGSQKSKNESQRWDRVELRLQLKDNYQSLTDSNRRFIFVDDLITTGATAYSAFLALSRPQHFEVWTMFVRPRLRPREGSDITHHHDEFV